MGLAGVKPLSRFFGEPLKVAPLVEFHIVPLHDVLDERLEDFPIYHHEILQGIYHHLQIRDAFSCQLPDQLVKITKIASLKIT